jgi:diketogulonate reductase-like aldo/keto reductase
VDPDQLSRRDFTVRAAGLAGSAFFARPDERAATRADETHPASMPPAEPDQIQGPLQRSAIPSSGQRIARVGLGTWQTFDVGADAARRAQLRETLRVFVDSGADLVDTSPMYGSSEEVLGDLMNAAQARERVFVATKVWTTGEDPGIQQMNESFRKLRIARAELMQVHNLVDWRTHLRTLRSWKDEGRVRYIGVTHYTAGAIGDVAAVVRAEPLDFVQLNLSLAEQDARSLLALCASRGVAFIANRPFGGGGALGRVRDQPLPGWATEQGIASWSQLLLRWILSHEEVTCAIPGTGNPRHLADNLAAARGPAVDARTRSQMENAWRSLNA